MYSTEQYDKDTMARAKIVSAVVSPKDSREVSAALRGKSVAYGLALLADVKAKKRPIRYTRFNQESAGHRRGTGPGRYPLKAAEAFETLLESARANAEFKDLDPELLRIVHIKADIGPQPFRFGRHRGRTGKRAHIEVVVVEDEKLKQKAKAKQSVSATKQKAESKTATKKESKTSETKSDEKAESKKDSAAAGATTQAPKTEKESKPETKTDAPKESADASEKKAATPQKEQAEAASKEPKADAPQKAESDEKKAAESSDASDEKAKKGDKQ